MRESQASLTAMGVAIIRAIEADKPAEQRICDDPYARHLVVWPYYLLMRLLVRLGAMERLMPGMFALTVARERHIDEYLQACLDEGLEQLVILGAGYDMRAWRFVDRLRGLRVFEVDHPGTQRDKLRRLQRVLGQIPAHVTYVPIDFNSQSLAQRLGASGYDPHARTLFIWQGVTQYLTPAAIDDTLAFVAGSSAPGSAVIFDYIDAAHFGDPHNDLGVLRRRLAAVREVIRFALDPATVGTFLEQRGFCRVQKADQHTLAGYFTGPNQGRSIATSLQIVSARVIPNSAKE